MTSLQQQLAKIAASSSHELDAKAQRAAHSQSLVFEPSVAATQSFDTIYQICVEGFDDLCELDVRFARYGSNIFSIHSKSDDREQMTKKENEDLDGVLDSFLSLVSSRLLLTPAVKALEWLVRRFGYGCWFTPAKQSLINHSPESNDITHHPSSWRFCHTTTRLYFPHFSRSCQSVFPQPSNFCTHT